MYKQSECVYSNLSCHIPLRIEDWHINIAKNPLYIRGKENIYSKHFKNRKVVYIGKKKPKTGTRTNKGPGNCYIGGGVWLTHEEYAAWKDQQWQYVRNGQATNGPRYDQEIERTLTRLGIRADNLAERLGTSHPDYQRFKREEYDPAKESIRRYLREETNIHPCHPHKYD